VCKIKKLKNDQNNYSSLTVEHTFTVEHGKDSIYYVILYNMLRRIQQMWLWRTLKS